MFTATADRIASFLTRRDTFRREDAAHTARLAQDLAAHRAAELTNPAPAVPTYSLSREAREARDAEVRAHLAATAGQAEVRATVRLAPTYYVPNRSAGF
jgi:hypothetical protein